MRILKIIIAIFFSLNVYGQLNSYVINDLEVYLAEKHLPFFNKARLSIEVRHYSEALPHLDSLLKYYPSSTSINFLSGVCKIYTEPTKAKGLFHLKLLNGKHQKLSNYNYWLGLAYEKNDSIAQAKQYYNKFLSENGTSDNETKEYIENAKRSIENLKTAESNKNLSNFSVVKNIGSPINTEESEYVPLLSSDESMMIYTYRGKLSKGGKQDVGSVMGISTSKSEEKIYFEDVFQSYRINDSVWSQPAPIKSINTALHDAAVTLSFDGTMLFIYKNLGKGNGDLYMSKLMGSNWTVPVYQTGLNTDKWEGSAAFFPDNRTIIFSSERKGGFGGKDLYVAEKIGENAWGNIRNLGSTINTGYDEDAPFITADGKILFYASNGKLSMGGYDVLRSDLTIQGWGTPVNIGKPVNTVNDDKFYVVTADGKRGYYSSKSLNGKGEQDIYCITPGIPDRAVKVIQVSGNITYNNKPVGGKLEIKRRNSDNEKKSKFNANSTTGKFLVNLPANEEFELEFSYKNEPVLKKYFSTKNIDTTMYLTVIADFYSTAFSKQLTKSRDSLDLITRKKYDRVNLADFRAKYGNLLKDSLSYQIQIAAYKFIENFDYSTSIRIGMKIRRSAKGNDVTRFTVGGYSTFNEAEEKLKVIKSQAIKDAFIIVLYKGKFCYLDDLIDQGVYK